MARGLPNWIYSFILACVDRFLSLSLFSHCSRRKGTDMRRDWAGVRGNRWEVLGTFNRRESRRMNDRGFDWIWVEVSLARAGFQVVLSVSVQWNFKQVFSLSLDFRRVSLDSLFFSLSQQIVEIARSLTLSRSWRSRGSEVLIELYYERATAWLVYFPI